MCVCVCLCTCVLRFQFSVIVLVNDDLGFISFFFLCTNHRYLLFCCCWFVCFIIDARYREPRRQGNRMRRGEARGEREGCASDCWL